MFTRFFSYKSFRIIRFTMVKLKSDMACLMASTMKQFFFLRETYFYKIITNNIKMKCDIDT